MNNVIQTKFVGRSPFKPKVSSIDLSTLKITADKPKKKRSCNYKYDALFSQLEIGKSLSCLPENTDSLSQALRSYVERMNKPWKVKAQRNYSKTTGRVFVLAKE